MNLVMLEATVFQQDFILLEEQGITASVLGYSIKPQTLALTLTNRGCLGNEINTWYCIQHSSSSEIPETEIRFLYVMVLNETMHHC